METLLAFIEALLGNTNTIVIAAPLIAILIDFAKRVGLPNERAPLASVILNVIAFGWVWYVGEEGEAELAALFGSLETLAPMLLAWVLSLIGTEKLHNIFVPMGIGFSHHAKVGWFRTPK